MRRHDLVLDTLVVHLNRVGSIVTPEHKQVLDRELLCLTPANLETCLRFARLFETLSIEQVKHFLVVDL